MLIEQLKRTRVISLARARAFEQILEGEKRLGRYLDDGVVEEGKLIRRYVRRIAKVKGLDAAGMAGWLHLCGDEFLEGIGLERGR